ncbi:MAG: hypothetical protein J6Z50_04915 [Fibrobacterales bacterium]|nr:hypothetical protein [Fibrobacterales bacterium]MBP5350978.1 hypothetical protein [Fibrobacterales bacterium]
MDRRERVGSRRVRVVFGASRSARIWAALFLLANIVMTLVLLFGMKKLGP